MDTRVLRTVFHKISNRQDARKIRTTDKSNPSFAPVAVVTCASGRLFGFIPILCLVVPGGPGVLAVQNQK
jgi:hypothetical protein